MKKRSLSSIILLSICTLGFYEIYWLASTRNEMVKKYRVRIPNASYMILIKVLQFIGAITVLAFVLFVAPAEQKKVSQAPLVPKPTANCYVDYNTDTSCKTEVDNFYGQPTDSSGYYYTLALLIVITMILLEVFYITRWLWPYAKGVGKVTGRWSKGKVTSLIVPGLLLPAAMTQTYYVVIIQNAFNKL